MRIGTGYDVHRLVEGRKLIIGGVEIPHTLGLLGHSDADVLLHAIMDALLGAAALGDIGKHFPDTDEAYRGISSLKLLEEVGRLLEEPSLRGGEYRRHRHRPETKTPALYRADGTECGRCAGNCERAGQYQGNHGGTSRIYREGRGDQRQAVCLLESFYDGSAVAADSEEGCAGCGGCPKTGGGY